MNIFQLGDQLWVNNKWFFDIMSINESDLVVRVKYKESIDRKYELYKQIKLPLDTIQSNESNDMFISIKLDEFKLKKYWGSLVDRLIKTHNPYMFKINEDAVSNPGFSGTPGVPGTSGSGDISNNVLISNNQTVKKVMLDLIDVNETLETDNQTENDYKKLVYNFLDYPWELDVEIDLCKEISNQRDEFLIASSVRIKDYFKDLSNINRALISKCSDIFQNDLLDLN